MIWLIGVIILLQSLYYWILKPLALMSTILFELKWIWLIPVGILIWLLANPPIGSSRK